MSLFQLAVQPALDTNGDPINGATWSFTRSGTSTPVNVYSSAALTTSLGSTVTADSAGRFATIFLDDDVLYRAILKDAGGTTIKDIDGVNAASFRGTSAISTSASAASNLATLNAEILALSTAGGGTLTIAPGTYPMMGEIVIRDNVHIVAPAAIFDGTGIYLFCALGTGADNWSVDGLTIDTDVAVNFGFRLFDITNFALRNVTIHRDGNGGYIGMLIGASKGQITNFKSTGSNGIWIEGNQLQFANGDMTAGAEGGDDCLVIKASYVSSGDPRLSSYDITITGWKMSGYAAAIAIGSEIGYFNTNDSTYARYASNISITGCTARNCASLLFIKPGANSGNVYADGTVQNVAVSSCTLEDLTGTKMKVPIQILAGRGGVVRQVTISNITIRGRCLDQASPNAAIMIQPYDYTSGSRASAVEDIFIDGVAVTDLYGGAANGGSAPGHPIDYGVYVERNIGSGGTAPTIGRIEVKNLYLNGCKRNAVYVGTGVTGPVKFRGGVLKNFCGDSGASAIDRGAFNVLSAVEAKDIEASVSSNAPAGSRPIMADSASDKTVEIKGDSHILDIGDLAAGNTTYRSFVAPRNCWIRKIELVNRAAITADATNKITIAPANRDTGNNIVSADSNTGFAVTANTPVSIGGTNQFSGADSLLPKGKTLDIAIVSGGTATLAGAALVVHYVPYGAA